MKNNTEFITDIIKAIIATGKLDVINWSEFSIVFGFDRKGNVNESSGSAYEAEGKRHTFSVKPRLVRIELNAYQEFISAEQEKLMKKLLLQFNRHSGRFNTEFEYENDSRWKITPNNFNETIAELKANL